MNTIFKIRKAKDKKAKLSCARLIGARASEVIAPFIPTSPAID